MEHEPGFEMPERTQEAVDWALQQRVVSEEYGVNFPVTKETEIWIVNYTREYFNENNIEYSTFDWYDVEPYVEASQYE